MSQSPTDFFASFPELVNLERLLQNPGARGEGVRVAIIDSGIDQEILTRRCRERGYSLKPVEGGLFTSDQSPPAPGLARPGSPHGTTVADIVVSLAPEISLFSADVVGSRGTCEVEVICRAIRWAMDEWKCKLINLSLGIPQQRLLQLPRRQLLYRVIEEAYYRDIIVVAAANNDHPASRSYPAVFAPILLSVDRYLFDDPTHFVYRLHDQVEFLAHGKGYYGPFSQEITTSWATAHLTGISARLLSLHPQIKLFELKTLLYWLSRHWKTVKEDKLK